MYRVVCTKRHHVQPPHGVPLQQLRAPVNSMSRSMGVVVCFRSWRAPSTRSMLAPYDFVCSSVRCTWALCDVVASVPKNIGVQFDPSQLDDHMHDFLTQWPSHQGSLWFQSSVEIFLHGTRCVVRQHGWHRARHHNGCCFDAVGFADLLRHKCTSWSAVFFIWLISLAHQVCCTLKVTQRSCVYLPWRATRTLGSICAVS